MISFSVKDGKLYINSNGSFVFDLPTEDGKYVVDAYKYSEILKYLDVAGVKYQPLYFPKLSVEFNGELRDYQMEAVMEFLKHKRGIIALPTGSGKTIIAAAIIAEMKISTLVVVPSQELLFQWRETLRKYLNYVPTLYYADSKDISPLTITTYQSAMKMDTGLFGFIVFDEVHHLPAEKFRTIAIRAPSPYRLGLSATPERRDGNEFFDEYFGGVIYRKSFEELRDYLASYRIIKVFVEMSNWEYNKYNTLIEQTRDFNLKEIYKQPSVHRKEMAILHKINRLLSLNSGKRKLSTL